MTLLHPSAAIFGRSIATFFCLVVATHLYGQPTTASAPTPIELAKYDKNGNGVLDPAELAEQRADNANGDATVMLTPFEVSTNKDVGYAAGNTVSGGRVDTSLAITPGSISVMTKEFLDDFNVTNINDAAAWTVGMDLASATPNSDTSTDATYQAIFRGAPAAGNFPTRDGSLNFGVADSYNSERFEFSRGPDSTMFGDGGPGGRQGSSSKRPRVNRTATTIATQIDTFGGYRATLDHNKGWDRFAIRLNMIRQNNKPYQDGMNRVKAGFTISGIVKLTPNTQFLVSYERIGEDNSIFGLTIEEQTQFWNNRTTNDNNVTLIPTPNTVGLEQVSATVDYFAYNFALKELVNYKGVQYRTRGTRYRIPYTGNPYIPASPARAFPSGISRKFLLSTEDQIIDRDSDTLALTLDHRIGNLFMQLGYTQNNYDITPRYNRSTPNEARIDVNKLLPDGRLNPNFLKTYADVGQSRDMSQDAVREIRALATYRFFVPRIFDYKQQFSLNGGYRLTKSESRSDSWRRVDNPLVTDPFNEANALNFRFYWDSPRPEYKQILSDPNKVLPGRWVNIDTRGSMTKRTLRYGSLFSQSAFFNEKLAISASVTKDESNVDSLPRFGSTGAPNYLNVLGSGAPNVHVKRSGGTMSTALGVVTYPIPARNQRMTRWLSPIGFVVNFSENSQQPSTGIAPPLITGEPAPTSNAKTLDFGIRYSIPGGKAFLTVSHYNTDQEDIVSGFGSQTDIRNIWLNLGYTDPTRTTTEFSYSDLSSRKLEGWEVELTANPWRNLTLTANYSHPLTYIRSESVYRKAYVAEHMDEWKAGAALSGGAVFNGRTILNSQIIRDSLLNIENSLNGLTTGTLATDSTRHRINFAARYAFREGVLRGFAFNGGINYRSHTKSGSRDAQIKFNTTTPTVAQVRAAAFDYLWVPPTYTISTGANYTRRIGKYQTRFQLNIANLLDEKDPIWGRNTSSGTNGQAYTVLTPNQLLNGNPRMQVLSGFYVLEPRKITFSTTVSF